VVELVAQGNVLGTYTSSPIELFSLFMERDRYVEIAVRFRLHSGQLLGGQASLCFQILEANGAQKRPAPSLHAQGVLRDRHW
jgi:hypothetical protein